MRRRMDPAECLSYNINDENGNTPLMIAAKLNRLYAVKSLISNGADIDGKNPLGKTALLIAAEMNYAEIIAYLVNKGANVNIADNEGYTPLIRAMMGGSFDTIKCLFASGADVNAKTNIGLTPLEMHVNPEKKDFLKKCIEERETIQKFIATHGERIKAERDIKVNEPKSI